MRPRVRPRLRLPLRAGMRTRTRMMGVCFLFRVSLFEIPRTLAAVEEAA